MPFLKLDCGILDSSLWIDKSARDMFLTALLMAIPQQFNAPVKQLEPSSLKETGWSAPPGWYGFVAAAGPGIARRALVDETEGLAALERLGSPDAGSRSNAFEGRRLIRIDGGYIVLNFIDYRDRDYTAAERMRALRQRRKDHALRRNTVTHRNSVTQQSTETETEAEAEAEADKEIKPSKKIKPANSQEDLLSVPSRAKSKRATIGELRLICAKLGLPESDAEWAFCKWEGNGWLNGGKPIRSFPGTLRAWQIQGYLPSQKPSERSTIRIEDSF